MPLPARMDWTEPASFRGYVLEPAVQSSPDDFGGINRDLRINHVLRNENANAKNMSTYLSWIFSGAILMSLCVICH